MASRADRDSVGDRAERARPSGAVWLATGAGIGAAVLAGVQRVLVPSAPRPAPTPERSEPGGEEEPAGPSYDEPSSKIREAGKWLVAASAAVGAALIAGSQLSDIGSLSLCREATLTCLRLPIAAGAAAVALAAVAYILWSAVRLLLPVGVPIDELARVWAQSVDRHGNPTGRKPRADVRFFLDNPEMLPATPVELRDGRAEADDLVTRRRRAVRGAEDPAAAAARVAEAEKALRAWDRQLRSVLLTAQYQLLLASFRGLIRRLIPAAVVAAVGLTTFAWASNPASPSVSLAGADLRNAQLQNAALAGVDLDGADLTAADLSGADLSGASLAGVTWRGTTCPDGTNSDSNRPDRPTCLGHLTP